MDTDVLYTTHAPIAHTAVPSSQLDLTETNVESAPEPKELRTYTDHDLGASFRHSGWAKTRQRTYDILSETNIPDARLLRFANCGRHAWVYRADDDPNLVTLRSDTCRDRWCVPCARQRAILIRNNVADYLSDLHRRKQLDLRMITLTLAADGASLKERLDRLYKSFRLLRASKLWTDHVAGAITFTELKWIPDTRNWHVHVHVLANGSYMDARALSAKWLRITHDSKIVHLTYCNDVRRVLSYVLKYVAKPLDNSVTDDVAAFTEAITTLKGRRLVFTTGDARSLQLAEKPEDPTAGWTAVESLANTQRRAANNDPDALDLIEALRKRYNICSEPRPPPQDPL